MRVGGFGECIMEDKTLWFECDGCGAEFGVETAMELEAEFCPYCGEPIEEVDWEIDDENIEQAVEV